LKRLMNSTTAAPGCTSRSSAARLKPAPPLECTHTRLDCFDGHHHG
jgi:hypothetical protein